MVNHGGRKFKELDYGDLLWRIASQWKGVLIVALIFAALVTFAKYSSDLRTYNANQVDAGNSLDIAGVYERINQAYSNLPVQDQTVVRQAIKQDEMIENCDDYISNSILMSLDPGNVKTICFSFQINDVEDEQNESILQDRYMEAFEGEEFLYELGKIISPNTSLEYIRELLAFNDPAEYQLMQQTIQTDKPVVKLFISVPDTTDEKLVLETLKKTTTKVYEETVDDTNHRIEIITDDAKTIVNNAISQRWYYNIKTTSDLKSWRNAYITDFSPQQQSVYNEITGLRSILKALENGEKPYTNNLEVPVLNKMYIPVGFALGIILYILILACLIILRQKIESANEAAYYTGCDLLGEVYIQSEKKGVISTILSSNYVSSIRYRNKMDQKVQIKRIINLLKRKTKGDNIGSVCIINATNSDCTDLLISNIEKEFPKWDISKIRIEDVENSISTIDNIIIITNNNSSISQIEDTMELCSKYEIERIGVVHYGTY